jgi:DNA-binding NarL/FixJ family response regulator
LRILVVDDHDIVTKGITAILHSRGIHVIDDARNGREAVNKARETNPDLIIMDIAMPVLDGFGAAKQIRGFLPNVPILFMSMYSGHQALEQAKAVGAQGFVAKEEAANTLLKAVDAVSKNETFFPV